MAKKKNQTKEEQLDLIDVQPENAKKILSIARAYKKAQQARLAALKEETDLKEKVLALVKDAKLQPLPDGTTKFKIDGMTISVKPRDELVRIIEEKEEEKQK